MIKIQLELPNEIEAIIKNQGYDVESYVDIILVRPLLDKIKTNKIAEITAEADRDIDVLTNEVKDRVKVGKQVFRKFEVTLKNKEPEIIDNVEVDNNGDPLLKFPKSAKVIKLD